MDYEALAAKTVLFDIAAGALLALLGVFVLTLRPRGGANVALAAYCLAAGGGNAIANAINWELVPPAVGWWSVAMYPAGAIALVWLALRWPSPLDATERRLLLLPTLLGIAAVVAGGDLYRLLFGAPDDLARVWRNLAFDALLGGTYFFLALLALRYPAAARRGDTDASRKMAVVSLALLLGVAARAGLFLVRPPDPLSPFLEPAAAGVLCLLWLRATARTAPHAGTRDARRLALLVPSTALGMMLFTYATSPRFAGDLGPLGLLRALGVAILAYAILKHQILGIDVKLRWTISKSTIAALFIAVFFIASETAQQFFGETLGSTYVGIAAAGALVFALAPLQRAAERLAEKAVPMAHAPVATDARETYAILLSRMLRDGRIDRREERALAHAATSLGLTPAEALELRHQAEDVPPREDAR